MSDVITVLAMEANDKAVQIARLKAENAKLRNEVDNLLDFEHLTSVAVAYAGCDECGEYKQTMLCLFAENAKLRTQLADVTESVGRVEGRCAKLRKLVRKVLQFERAGCERCPYASTCDVDCLYESDCPMRKDIEQDMRELGVEVTE